MRREKREERKNKRILVILTCLLLIAVLVSTGTIAWLTKTSSVSNIFTVGSFESPSTSPTNPEIPIELDGNIYEPSWNPEEEHKLIPAATFEKDPYVGIGAGSEDAAVYVFVENSFTNKVYFTINEGWEAVSATNGFKEDTYTSGLFKYTAGLTASSDTDSWTETPLFSSVSTDETATIDDFTVEGSEQLEIKVSCFLHQKKDSEGSEIPALTIENAAKEAFDII